MANPTFASLNSRACSQQAHDFISGLKGGLEHHEQVTGARVYKRIGRKLEEFAWAVGAFAADVLRAAGDQDADGWTDRPLSAQSFSGERVTKRTFDRIRASLAEVRYLDVIAGQPKWRVSEFEAEKAGVVQVTGKATQFKGTRTFLNLAAFRGITPENVEEHFIRELPSRPLILKASSTRDRFGNKAKGKRINYRRRKDLDMGRAGALEADVLRLNSFLEGFSLTGGVHSGYVRVFNQGDLPRFDWNKGGRLYSQGDPSYQRLKKHDRVAMTIGGEPVVEIDIKASFLTVLHGLLGLTFDPSDDPYRVNDLRLLKANGTDLSRWACKQWTLVTLGHDKLHARWPRASGKEFKKFGLTTSLGKLYPIKKVEEAMAWKHPILNEWGSLSITWADLMFAEAEALIGTMLELMDKHGVPSLSVHDSLIVRTKDLGLTEEVLSKRFEAVCGIKPFLEVTWGACEQEKLAA